MLTNYLKIALRSFKKHRLTFLINLFGLTLGLTTVILIMMWVKDELSINRYHALGDRIYTVFTNHDNSTGVNTIEITPVEMAEAMEAELSQVEMAAAISPYITGVSFDDGKDAQVADGFFVDQEYLEMFSINFLEGDKSKALSDINSVVLSESTAIRIFGSSKEAVGKSLKWSVFEFGNDVIVRGVYRDFGSLDVDKPEFLLSFPYFKKMLGDGAHWDNFNAGTFLLLKEGKDIDSFNSQIKNFIKDKEAESNVAPFVQAFEDNYLYGSFENGQSVGGRIELIRMFGIISIMLLFIAGINFVNLSTAQSDKRSKEVGIRKLSGANKGMLIGQFLAESTMIALVSYLFALVLVSLLFPWFKELVGQDLQNPLNQPFFWTASAVYVLSIGIFAGSYPAFLMSSYRPAIAMKSKLNTNRSFGVKPREVFVVFQFAVVVILISSVWIVRDQMDFVQNRDLGIDKDNLIFHPVTQNILKN